MADNSQNASSPFDVERATSGLVMALFLAATLLLAFMLYGVLQDVNSRTAADDEASSPTSMARPAGNVAPVAAATAQPLGPDREAADPEASSQPT
jgi:hypothetical protein